MALNSAIFDLNSAIRFKKTELEKSLLIDRIYKTKGATIRSKARRYNEGDREKKNKHFLNLENRHCKRKTIMQIKTKDGVNITNDSDILRECNSFYINELYPSKGTKRTENLEELFFDQEHPKLNQIDKEKCEGLLSEKECLEAVKSMQLGKSPGTDGLPAEFYKVFWKDISPFLLVPLIEAIRRVS